VHEYLVRPEVVRVALVVGVVISMLFYERVQLTTGGAIVPAYLALHLAAPLFILSTIIGGYLTYLVVNVVIARRTILYGRRKFEIEVLVGLGIITVTTIVAGQLGTLDPILLGLAGIGFLVPGILAHDMARQRPGRTVLAVLATTGVLGVVIYVYDSLLAIAPVTPSSVPALASVAGYDRDFLLVGVVVSVLVGMLVFARIGVRSGGFITGAYLALLAPRWLDVLFTLVVGVATWFIVVHLLMPRLLIFGRRKLSTMVLVGAILAWSGELFIAWMTHGDVLIWRGLTIMTMMAPALLANDAQRQGWEKTLWGAGLVGLGVYGTMNLLSAGATAVGLA
jgi:poly-gamma-glutamate biosynthesis protein PgsC/CapC